jgi:hypothetical protein
MRLWTVESGFESLHPNHFLARGPVVRGDRMARLAALWLIAVLGVAELSPGVTAAPGQDLYATWDRLLSTYVDDEGLVDYATLKANDLEAFEAFMRTLAEADPDSFPTEQARIAFWINAYNAVVIWQVVERYPVDSVRDVGALWGLIGGFFKQEYPVAGRHMSADDIEHGTLREKFDDERIHWALVCAAFGCPRLLNRAYRPETLEETLRAQSYEFLAQPRGLQVDRDGETLYLSSYFDWYAGDFEAAAGDVVDYVLRYAPDDAAGWIRAHRDSMTVRIMDYDWTLNSQQNGPRSARPIPRD